MAQAPSDASTLRWILSREEAPPISEDKVLLMTATVNPGAMSFVERRDPRQRLEDYLTSLSHWLANPDTPPIVFCENSGYDLSGILQRCRDFNRHHKQVEFLSCAANDYPPALGKGYGEIGIISTALKSSHLIAPCSRVIKITGRHYVTNIRSLIHGIAMDPGVDVFCDLRQRLTFADSRVFCASVAFLERFLIPLRAIADDSKGLTMEHVLGRAVHESMSKGLRWSLLPVSPNIRGTSATLGVAYPTSVVARARREMFRRLKAAVLAR